MICRHFNASQEYSKHTAMKNVVRQIRVPLIEGLEMMNTHDVRCHWVKGHAENEQNNRCDVMAVAESRKFK